MAYELATQPSQVAAMAAQARAAHGRAMSLLDTLESPAARVLEQGAFVVTLAGCGYVSGRFNNPKVPVIGAPFELLGALAAYAGALAGMQFGAPAWADRTLVNMGTAFIASPLFKWAAGMGVKARPTTATTAPPGTVAKGSNTGLATPRREIVGAAVPRHTITGALSAAEAARLVAR